MSYKQRIVKSRLVCPKCKSLDLMLCEVWFGHEIVWEQFDGEFDREDGVLEPGGPHHVEAECKKCKHHWKPRNAHQIDSIIPV